MSMTTDVVYGYGFSIDVSDEIMILFAMNHKDTIAKLDAGERILKWLVPFPDESIKEVFSNYENSLNGHEGIYGLVADVMYKETGIGFEYKAAQDEEGKDAIMLPQMYPWQMNECEKALFTEQDLEKICRRYIEELRITAEPEYIRMEYFG